MPMRRDDEVRVFIGSGEASRIERKVLLYSLQKHSTRKLDLWIYNGTHNAIERNDDRPIIAPLSLHLKYKSVTEFSLYRYIIPALCGHKGRAIYLDSDMICLGDIGELYDMDMNNNQFLSVRSYGKGEWATSVMLIDCYKSRFDLEKYFEDIDSGLYSYLDFCRFSPVFLKYHDYDIGELGQEWNSFDKYDGNTKLVHYTALMTQPWQYPNHPFGDLWFDYLNEAIKARVVTDDDIHLSLARGYVRPDIINKIRDIRGIT